MTREPTEDVAAREHEPASDEQDGSPNPAEPDTVASEEEPATAAPDEEPTGSGTTDEAASPAPRDESAGPQATDDEGATAETSVDETDPPTDGGPILLFDGVCNLCTGLVQFLIPRDPEGKLRYGSLQSDAGTALLERFGLPSDSFDTLVLVEGDEYYTRSSAVLRIAKHLGRPYSWLYPFRYVPRPIRDAVYGLVARYRYRIFGQKDQCMMPPPDVESRFIE